MIARSDASDVATNFLAIGGTLFGQDFVARLAKDLDGVDNDATILMIRSGELQRDLSLGYNVQLLILNTVPSTCSCVCDTDRVTLYKIWLIKR